MGNLFVPDGSGKFNQQSNPKISLTLKEHGICDAVLDGDRTVVIQMLVDAMYNNPDFAGVLFTAVYARLDQMTVKSMPEFKRLTWLRGNGNGQ